MRNELVAEFTMYLFFGHRDFIRLRASCVGFTPRRTETPLLNVHFAKPCFPGARQGGGALIRRCHTKPQDPPDSESQTDGGVGERGPIPHTAKLFGS